MTAPSHHSHRSPASSGGADTGPDLKGVEILSVRRSRAEEVKLYEGKDQ